MKTVAGLCAVIFLLGGLFAEAQAQQNLGKPRKGFGLGEAGPTFHPPSRSQRFRYGPRLFAVANLATAPHRHLDLEPPQLVFFAFLFGGSGISITSMTFDRPVSQSRLTSRISAIWHNRQTSIARGPAVRHFSTCLETSRRGQNG
jgi:hypothetical protein